MLSIQSNRITVIEGLQDLARLEELYLSHNGIKCIQGLENLVSLCKHTVMVDYYGLFIQVNLNTLDLASNQIKKLENVAHLVNLEEFWVCFNPLR